MERVVITGIHGYISNRVKRWFSLKGTECELLDLRDASWKNYNFENVDTVIHCAALVHKKEKCHSLEEYMAVNCNLTTELAKVTKKAGVKNFIFISTMAVYGVKASCFRTCEINKDTEIVPITKYGISKYEAEKNISEMISDDFNVVIIRPPFVYGKGCPGNYGMLRKLVLKFGIVPKLQNKKSMIYIDNLCECIYQIYSSRRRGTFCPQDSRIVSTEDLSLLIGKYNNRKITRLPLGCLVKLASFAVSKIRVAFGNEYYSEEFSTFDFEYRKINFEEAVRLTEEQ